MKLKLIYFLILFSTFRLNLLSQIDFLGFDQQQCGLIENNPYTYRSISGGKYSTPGYQILKNGDVIYTGSNFESNVPYWIEELKFINDSTGWLVETVLYTSFVKKTTDSGKTWKQIGSGFGDFNYGHFCGFFLVNLYTSFLITSYYYGNGELMISRAAEFSNIGKRFIVDSTNSQITLNDTIYGDPFCIIDTLTFRLLVNDDTIKVKINLSQLGLPVNINTLDATKKMYIFPNPSTDYIRIQYDEEIKLPVKIYIHDILGKIVLSKIISSPLGKDIFIGDLPEGIYLVKIPTANSILQAKFLINNR